MRRTAILIALFAAALCAAPWDGIKGSVSAFTFTQPGYLPGVPGMTPGTPALTVMWLACADPTVTALRVRISYHDETGEHQTSILSDLTDGRGIAVTAIPQSTITAVQFRELRDGGVY